MTIALGILAKDGVVIAADTEESIGDSKVETRKIFTRLIESEHRGFSATGAGNSVFLDALHYKLAVAWHMAADEATCERELDKALRRFYSQHIRATRLRPVHRPESVVGLSWPAGQWLVSTEENVIRFCKDHVAVGIGADYAEFLLDGLVPRKEDISVELAAYIAAYVISRVKEFRSGCGKGTHVTLLQQGRGRYIAEAAIELLDSTFKQYARLDTQAASYILGREAIGSPPDIIRERLIDLQKRVCNLTPP